MNPNGTNAPPPVSLPTFLGPRRGTSEQPSTSPTPNQYHHSFNYSHAVGGGSGGYGKSSINTVPNSSRGSISSGNSSNNYANRQQPAPTQLPTDTGNNRVDSLNARQQRINGITGQQPPNAAASPPQFATATPSAAPPASGRWNERPNLGPKEPAVPTPVPVTAPAAVDRDSKAAAPAADSRGDRDRSYAAERESTSSGRIYRHAGGDRDRTQPTADKPANDRWSNKESFTRLAPAPVDRPTEQSASAFRRPDRESEQRSVPRKSDFEGRDSDRQQRFGDNNRPQQSLLSTMHESNSKPAADNEESRFAGRFARSRLDDDRDRPPQRSFQRNDRFGGDRERGRFNDSRGGEQARTPKGNRPFGSEQAGSSDASDGVRKPSFFGRLVGQSAAPAASDSTDSGSHSTAATHVDVDDGADTQDQQYDNSRGQYSKSQLLGLFNYSQVQSKPHDLVDLPDTASIVSSTILAPVNLKPLTEHELLARRNGTHYFLGRSNTHNTGGNSKPISRAGSVISQVPQQSHQHAEDSDLNERNWRHHESDSHQLRSQHLSPEPAQPAAQQQASNNYEYDLPADADQPGSRWYYIDPRGQTQGPFDSSSMKSWYEQKYFDLKLRIQCNVDQHPKRTFVPLGLWFLSGRRAFLESVPDIITADQQRQQKESMQEQQQQQQSSQQQQQQSNLRSPQQQQPQQPVPASHYVNQQYAPAIPTNAEQSSSLGAAAVQHHQQQHSRITSPGYMHQSPPQSHFSPPTTMSHVEVDDIQDIDRYTSNLRIDDDQSSPPIHAWGMHNHQQQPIHSPHLPSQPQSSHHSSQFELPQSQYNAAPSAWNLNRAQPQQQQRYASDQYSQQQQQPQPQQQQHGYQPAQPGYNQRPYDPFTSYSSQSSAEPQQQQSQRPSTGSYQPFGAASPGFRPFAGSSYAPEHQQPQQQQQHVSTGYDHHDQQYQQQPQPQQQHQPAQQQTFEQQPAASSFAPWARSTQQPEQHASLQEVQQQEKQRQQEAQYEPQEHFSKPQSPAHNQYAQQEQPRPTVQQQAAPAVVEPVVKQSQTQAAQPQPQLSHAQQQQPTTAPQRSVTKPISRTPQSVDKVNQQAQQSQQQQASITDVVQRNQQRVQEPAPKVDLDALEEQQRKEREAKQPKPPAASTKTWIAPKAVQAPEVDLRQLQEQDRQAEETAAIRREMEEAEQRKAEAAAAARSKPAVWGKAPVAQPNRPLSLKEIQEAEAAAFSRRQEQLAAQQAAAASVGQPSAWSHIVKGRAANYVGLDAPPTAQQPQQAPQSVVAQPRAASTAQAPAAASRPAEVSDAQLWQDVPVRGKKQATSATPSKTTTPQRAAAPTSQQTSTPSTKPSSAVGDEFNLGSDVQMSREMNDWCSKQLQSVTGSSDTTLATFLFTLDTDDQVSEYTHAYLGQSPQVDEFIKGFLQHKAFDKSSEAVKPSVTPKVAEQPASAKKQQRPAAGGNRKKR